jgi:hypothetical protein
MPAGRQVEIEVRQIYDVGEFVPRRAVEKARGEGKKLAARKT